MASKQVAFRVNELQYSSLEQLATDEDLTLSEYMRELVLPPADKILHLASGRRYPRFLLKVVLDAAEEAIDNPVNRGMVVADWLAQANELVAWLSANHWHPECEKRTVALMESVPDQVKKQIAADLRDILT
jgi:hypothetical protein